MEPEDVEHRLEEGRRHLHFVAGLCKLQMQQGRHFLFEHPEGALSWQDAWIKTLCNDNRTHLVTSDQCEYGLVTHNVQGELVAAKKPAKWLTTSVHMAKRLSTRCSGQHVHEPLLGGRAAQAAFYPMQLVTEILRGIRDTADAESSGSDGPSKGMRDAMAKVAALHDDPPSVLASLKGEARAREARG